MTKKAGLMTPIHSTGYTIFFNDDAYKSLNVYLYDNQIVKIFVLVDENTKKYCLEKFQKSLDKNIEIVLIEISAGEVYKNIETCTFVWKKLTELEADRKSILINLGGGMITDLGGFVASTFKRGIRFINIPTTLLSMVDASVGSKTGVDLDNLKNLVGMFANPEMVLIDTCYLQTLPEREMISGLAEIIKYGLTFNAKLLEDCKNDMWKDADNLDKMIHQSIVIKNDVVLKDIKETSLRKVLNYGHTIGHAVESFHLNTKELPDLTHGEAIAIGMVIEGYISSKLHGFPTDELSSLKTYIHKTYGKTDIAPQHYDAIIDLMRHDKKNSNGNINYILLKNITDFVIDANAPVDLVIEGFNYYSA
ncbi:MAG: 3-dehydroquinate synthase [Flavobacteriaceae bacterium]